MKGHDVATVGRSLPLRGFAGDRHLVITEARLVADHGPGTSLTGQAVTHGVARGLPSIVRRSCPQLQAALRVIIHSIVQESENTGPELGVSNRNGAN